MAGNPIVDYFDLITLAGTIIKLSKDAELYEKISVPAY